MPRLFELARAQDRTVSSIVRTGYGSSFATEERRVTARWTGRYVDGADAAIPSSTLIMENQK